MTVYYYDLFTGTAGTLLTSHTANSGATWPNDTNHLTTTNLIELDGTGMVFSSGTAPTLQIPSATQPSTQNFEILYSFVRLTPLAEQSSGAELIRATPFATAANDVSFTYCEGWNGYTGFYFLLSDVPQGTGVPGPAIGVTWYIKVDVWTLSGPTYFDAYYSTTSGGPWTVLTSWSIATLSDPVTAGLRFVPVGTTAATVTTGHHIGALYVQDIPAPSTATISGPTQALFSTQSEFTVILNDLAGSGGIVVSLVSSNGSDTFQATEGGVNITSITIPQGSTVGTFWLTPGGTTGSRNITITAGSLSCPNSPYAYNAMTTATAYTVSGATAGHQNIQVTWTTTLTGGDFKGNIIAIPGGGVGQCQIYSPSAIAFAGNGTTSQSFSFTPLDADSVTYTFTNSGSLTNPSPITYTSTGIYLEDTFAGSSGTTIQSHSSNALPGIPSGSTWGAPSGGAIELDGSGKIFLAALPASVTYSGASLPPMSVGTYIEYQWDFLRVTSVSGAVAGIVFMESSGNYIDLYYTESGNQWWFYQNGSTELGYANVSPAVGTTWRMKLDAQVQSGGNTQIWLYYSSNGGTTWTAAFSTNFDLTTSSDPTAWSVGMYFSGAAGSASTGLHMGNLVVQDTPPPTPNCVVQSAWIASSGQSAVFLFETSPGDVSVTPTAMIYAPSFYQNGTAIPQTGYLWANGSTPCTVLLFPAGVQIIASDVITMLAPASWAECGSGNAVAGFTSGAPLTFSVSNGNNFAPITSSLPSSAKSAFGTDALTKTLKPGFNISYNGGTVADANFNLCANLRQRMKTLTYSGYLPDGTQTAMFDVTDSTNVYDFLDPNSVDFTEYPGVSGYFAIGYDDDSYSTSPTTLSLVPPPEGAPNPANTYGAPWTSQATVNATIASGAVTGFSGLSGGSGYPVSSTTIPVSIYGTGSGARAYATSNSGGVITALTLTTGGTGYTTAPTVLIGAISIVEPYHSCDNTGSSGIGQFYMYQVSQTLGSVCANIPIYLQWTNEQKTPNISNLYILYGGKTSGDPNGDFTWTPGTPLTFSRPTTPYVANIFKNSMPNGCGVLRFMDSMLGDAGVSNVSEPWEMHGLTDFSWNNSNLSSMSQTTNTVYLSEIRGLYTSNSPYFYGDPTTLPLVGQSWTAVATLGATVTSTQTTLSIASAATDPIFYGLLLTIDSEKMRVRGVSGSTVTVERGSSGSTAASHSSGATITISSRFAWVSISNLASLGWGGSSQVIEVLTQSGAPHGFKPGQQWNHYGTYPTVSFTDGSQQNIGGTNWPMFPTGPSSYAIFCLQNGVSSLVTIASGTTYALIANTCSCTYETPDIGYPYEFQGIATSTFRGCNLHMCLPLLCSDSYAYAAFEKVLASTVPGRKVYVELADEPWNNLQVNLPLAYLSRLNNGNSWPWYYVTRLCQLRTIGRTVFGSRANEIQALINVQPVYPSMAQTMLSIAQGIGTPIDAVAIAPYIGPDSSTASVNAWNACSSIAQMADLLINEWWFDPDNPNCGTANLGIPGQAGSGFNGVIYAYNQATGNNCTLIGYEGGYQTGCPSDDPARNHDIEKDPVWRIYEKDYYAWLQQYGFTGCATYAHSLYYYAANCWGVYKFIGQQPGLGDGSDGKANNRDCLCSPEFTESKSATTNQDANTVSVRGQAHLEWMADIETATLAGPSSGTLGSQSTAFTVTLSSAAPGGGVVVGLASTNGSDTFQAASGGSNVSSVAIPAGSTFVTFYLTPGGTAGNRSISITTSPSLTYSGSPITYSAAAVPTAATLSGPSTGFVGVQSTAFTVTVNQPAAPGGVTVAPASTNGSDTFQAGSGGSNVSSVTIPAGSTSVTFYLTPGGTAGNRSISIKTSPSLTYSGSPITYSAAARAPRPATR